MSDLSPQQLPDEVLPTTVGAVVRFVNKEIGLTASAILNDWGWWVTGVAFPLTHDDMLLRYEQFSAAHFAADTPNDLSSRLREHVASLAYPPQPMPSEGLTSNKTVTEARNRVAATTPPSGRDRELIRELLADYEAVAADHAALVAKVERNMNMATDFERRLREVQTENAALVAQIESALMLHKKFGHLSFDVMAEVLSASPSSVVAGIEARALESVQAEMIPAEAYAANQNAEEFGDKEAIAYFEGLHDAWSVVGARAAAIRESGEQQR